MRTTKHYEETNRWEYAPWGYLLPDVYAFEDNATELVLCLGIKQQWVPVECQPFQALNAVFLIIPR